MIATVFWVAFRRLMHNRVELLLTFVVPIVFFSIFALIFGKGLGGATTPKIKAVVIDCVNTPISRSAVDRIREIDSLRLLNTESKSQTLTEKSARDLVRRGMVTIAVVVKENKSGITADLLNDASDQVAGQVASALITQALVSVPSNPTPDFSKAVNQPPVIVRGQSVSGPVEERVQKPIANERALIASAASYADKVRLVDVISGSRTNPVISMYAAGIAVMFLLFGASSGGGSLLEEQESHTLHRLLTTQLTIDHLLLGKWVYQTFLGVTQTIIMFVWGWLVFGVDLWSHVDGFLLITIVTAGAASSFGLFMATLSRSRGQLNGISIILILSMSALGGSMVPRYLMGDSLKTVGLFTFNAWALDGYDKVFWRELPVSELWPQTCVLMISGAAFLVVARILAIRWESA